VLIRVDYFEHTKYKNGIPDELNSWHSVANIVDVLMLVIIVDV